MAPNQLLCPWDSPGKNTGMGFHFLLQVKVKSLSHIRLFATPQTVAHQAPPSVGFSRQEYWSGLPFSSPRDLPDPGIELRSPSLQADALTSEPPGKLTFKMRVLAILTSYSVFLDLSLVYILLNFFDFLLLICLMSI